MKTSNFFSYTGPGRISIARFAPRGTAKGFRVFRGLAPGTWFNSVPHETYLKLYANEILAKLDPRETWDTLHEMAAGAEPVLLCWEKPAEVNSGKVFCHRRQVAAWFEERLGVVVPEFTLDEQPRS